MNDASPTILGLIGVSVGLGLVTFLVVTATSFVKVSVVLFILRNALGIQQTPPNLVLYGIALALSFFIMSPVISGVSEALRGVDLSFASAREWTDALGRAEVPLKAHLTRLTNPVDRDFFVEAARQLYPPGEAPRIDADGLSILIPSFLVAELTRAFQIGFLLYLPFIVIDLVVTTVLMAMGMSMVSPSIISTPLKLFLFVAISGWTRLVQGLVLSYAI